MEQCTSNCTNNVQAIVQAILLCTLWGIFFALGNLAKETETSNKISIKSQCYKVLCSLEPPKMNCSLVCNLVLSVKSGKTEQILSPNSNLTNCSTVNVRSTYLT